jgi:hypothetical protein
MGQITKRIVEFRGINRSLRPGAIDLAYAFNAENVNINGGRLSNDIGNYRCIYFDLDEDRIPIGKPNFLYIGSSDIYMITRDKYCKLKDLVIPGTGEEWGMFEPKGVIAQDIVNDTNLYIRGVGRSSLLANINNEDCLIASGMLSSVSGGYWTFRDFYVDGAQAYTAVYYLGTESPEPKIHCRKFGSGLYMFKDVSVLSTDANEDGVLTSITIDKSYASLTDAEKNRLTLDGVYLFSEAIGADVDEDDINNAYMWIEVTSIENDGAGNVQLNVSTKRQATDVLTGSYAYLRGGCSDMTVTFMTMFYGRLFAAAHRSNADHPLRLYWSCLPGDGRTIEDWTMSDASIDTSGGHVDIGDPSDGYITGLVTCGSQLLIFTQTRLWRLYGTSPSSYTLDLVGEMESPRVSSAVEINGAIYWLTVSGLQYYNGSYIAKVSDSGNLKNVLEAFPRYMQDVFMYSTVHAVLFDNSIIFAFDVTAHKTSRGSFVDGLSSVDECWLLRYDLENNNIIEYRVPAERFRQQFVDVITRNFGVNGGKKVMYESRLIQTIVHKPEYDPEDPLTIITPESMSMTQWHHWQDQEYGWWDESKPHSMWQTGWTDMQTPEAVKKVHTICLRGSGEFTLTIESDINKEVIEVKMPDDEFTVKDLTPRYAQGRSFRFTIESEKPFTIEPYMTLLFEYGGIRL